MSNEELNYLELCNLHVRYKKLVSEITKTAYVTRSADLKMNELDSILKNVESLPIPWRLYYNKCNKFSQDFEDLIIFSDR